jgi:hypothetical protein
VNFTLRDIPWRLIIRFSHAAIADGIEMRVFAEAGDADVVFSGAADALRLIAGTDPNRYRRIRRDVDRLLFTSASGGRYLPRLRTCCISIDYAMRKSTLDLAMMIVHEATHARLWTLGCRYEEGEREQVERTCVNAEVAFASRIAGAESSIARSRELLESRWWLPEEIARDDLNDLRAHGLPELLVRLLERSTRRRPRDDATG